MAILTANELFSLEKILSCPDRQTKKNNNIHMASTLGCTRSETFKTNASSFSCCLTSLKLLSICAFDGEY